ncbi:transcription cofactor HES-6 isoform X2 [Balaenoptera musculus]|uniref:Transcription cofactor HES-6 isoform X2 n=1 Tax=Balaenoptera musculus TaxID=9771 RepID=A0A8B8XWU9_BALMU|nr:transcription cofactor HES-6 isoform X2 [Balaenoptera musculus]
MAPLLAPGRDRAAREDEDGCEARGDRKARKPLVEKKRRARINESLQELRLLLAGAEVRPAGGRPGAAGERAGGGRRPASPHRPSPPGAPAGAGAGQAGERRGAGAHGAARAGRAAGPGARTRAAAGGSKRALRRRLHPVHARGAHVRVYVPGNRRHRRRRAPEPPARVHAAARGQQLPGSAGGRPVRATGSPWAEQLASRRRPGVPTAQPPGLRGRPVLRPGGGPRG